MSHYGNTTNNSAHTTNDTDTTNPTQSTKKDDSIASTEENATLQKALGSLIAEFSLLRESVNTVHVDYADLKETISKQKEEVQHELSNKIESNIRQLSTIAEENKYLRRENDQLKHRLTKIEKAQLGYNVTITGIQEGPFEPYQMTKLHIQEMIATTIDSGDTNKDLESAKKIEITCCSRVGKFRHNRARPISVTFVTV